MWVIILITVLVGGGMAFVIYEYFKMKEKLMESNRLREEVMAKYAPIMDLEGKQDELRRENDIAREGIQTEARKAGEEMSALKLDYIAKKAFHDTLMKKIRLLQGEEEMLDAGVYEPQFDLEDSEKFKLAIKRNNDQQKEAVRAKTACSCNTVWQVGGSKREGQKMVNQQIKLMLRAFNGESDSVTAKVKWNNVTRMEERIKKAYEAINKQGESSSTSLSHDYLMLKLEELYLTHEKNVKIQDEKEEQREIREQMREEARAQKEYDKAERDAAKEEEDFQKALEKAREELSKASDEERELLNEKLRKLEADLAEAHSKKERIMSQAQLTRRGHVYVISNLGSFGDDMLKIGMTRRLEPLDRVKELGDASVPFKFDVHAMIYSDDAPSLEKTLHKQFNHRRVNKVNSRKEFFRVGLSQVQDVASALGLEIEFTKLAEAKEYRESVAIEAEKEAAPALDNSLSNETGLPDEL